MGNELFQPVPPRVSRMSASRKMNIIEGFSSGRPHYSPSGLTANIAANWCLLNQKPFTITWHPDKGFVIQLGVSDGH